MSAVSSAELCGLIRMINADRLAAPALETSSRDSWRRHDDYFETLVKKLVDQHGAKFRKISGDISQLTLGGIRSSSTGGLRQMLANWVTAASKLIDARAGVGGEA